MFTSLIKAVWKPNRLKVSAAETANLAQNLPDRAAIVIAVSVAIKEKHH